MPQDTINERIKFLIETLGLSARGFSMAIGSSDTNTRNYLDRGSKPGADYLERILRRFETINGTWLLTGKGDPFIPPTNGSTQTVAGDQKFFRSPLVNTNNGTAYNEQSIATSADAEAIKNKLALAEQEVEHLKAQLATTNALLAAKDETITLLRISYNRPN